MANVAFDQIRSSALALSESERSELARDLLASLDSAPDPDWSDAWDAEILRRLKQIEDKTAQFMDRAELTHRIRELLKPE